MTKQEEAIRDQQIVELIHQNTLRILEEIGVAFLTEESRQSRRNTGIFH